MTNLSLRSCSYLPLSLLACVLLTGCPDTSRTGDAGLHPGSDLTMTGDGPVLTVCGACAAPTPHCNPQTKRCVACIFDADCPAATVCSKFNQCLPGCAAGHDDCGDAGSCNLDGGVCSRCRADVDCSDPAKPSCEVATGRCAACTTLNDKCPLGSYCGVANGAAACVTGCKIDIECQAVDGGSAALRCCDHACADTGASLAHCGGCGMACNKSACCAGQCTDSQSDATNCGGCGVLCSSQNNVPVCAAGTCSTGACNMGFGDCNHDPKDGCETNTGGDVRNCGACATPCQVANASPLCIGGVCSVGACDMGYRNCNQIAADGCEANVQTDPRNCGVCGVSCASLPNANAGCANGGCSIGSCLAGYGDCNKNPADGCESRLASDAANCGTCGMKCPAPPNVITTCSMGMCSMGGCLPNFVDCNMNLGDGCEVNTATDPRNCGACATACPALPNAAPGCAMGKCGLGACNSGWADCDNNPANGCELPVSGDKNNCGACGNVCVNLCVNGACVTGPACSNGSYVDCNPATTTLIPNSAYVDPTPPAGWVQCFGFVNTPGDDVSNRALDNCLNTPRLRFRMWDANNALVVDVYHTNLNSWPAWPVQANYLDGCNCRGVLQLPVCNATYWPCNNNSTFYSSSSGQGGGGCGGYNAGAPTLSNGNATPTTLAIGQTDARELWAGTCYGNTPYPAFKAAVYK